MKPINEEIMDCSAVPPGPEAACCPDKPYAFVTRPIAHLMGPAPLYCTGCGRPYAWEVYPGEAPTPLPPTMKLVDGTVYVWVSKGEPNALPTNHQVAGWCGRREQCYHVLATPDQRGKLVPR